MADKKKPTKSVMSAATKSSKGKKTVKVDDTKIGGVSKADYTQPLIVKNSQGAFGEKLAKVKEMHKDTLEDLIIEMDTVKRENERLRSQQEDTYGITVDTVERMKHELERARTTRTFLLEDIEVRKGRSEKMEAEIFELNMKLESYMKQINEFTRAKREWNETSHKLSKIEEKCEKLAKTNKNLRMLLIKHHIDPKSVEFDSGRSRRSTKSENGKPQLKPILKPSSVKKKPDAHTQSHSNSGKTPSLSNTGLSKRISRSYEDLTGKPAETFDMKRSVTTRKAMGRGPPSYLGYYTSIHSNRLVGQPRTDYRFIQLPKLITT